MKEKTINILGDTQAEQWHTVVNLLRQLGGSLDYEGRDNLCNELDRYIDGMEDATEKLTAEVEKMEHERETIAARVLELLDNQAENCRKAGASVGVNHTMKPTGGSRTQNSYYFGHLNMAEAIAWELHKDVAKENGKHIFVDDGTAKK